MLDGYVLVAGPPPVDAYRRLRAESGLTPRTEEQSRLAIAGTWWSCHGVHQATGEIAAMGRVIGDGGWYFHIADMATLPAHQRRGLGAAVLEALLDRIRTEAPEGAYVSLMADPPGRTLYRRLGFVDDPTRSIGMARWLG